MRLGRVPFVAAADGVDDDDAEGVLVGLEGGLAGGAVVDGGVDGAVQLHQAVAEVRHAVRRARSAIKNEWVERVSLTYLPEKACRRLSEYVVAA